MQRKDLNNKVDLNTYIEKCAELDANIKLKADKTVVSTSEDGLMSSSDKLKLDGIASNANNYVHPSSSGNKHIPSGGSSGQFLKWSADGTAAWANVSIPDYEEATATKKGLMSSSDKSKLDGIAMNANNYTHPTTSGNKHIPSGGKSGQMLVWNSDGTAKWENAPLVCEDFPTGSDFNLDESDFIANSVFTEEFARVQTNSLSSVSDDSDLINIIESLNIRISLLENKIMKGDVE